MGDRQQAVLEVVAVIYDEKAEVAANLQAERVPVVAHARAVPAGVAKEGLRYQKSAPLKPGLYQVRVVVREEGTGRLGSASEWVEVPDAGRGTSSRSAACSSPRAPAEAVPPAAAVGPATRP